MGTINSKSRSSQMGKDGARWGQENIKAIRAENCRCEIRKTLIVKI